MSKYDSAKLGIGVMLIASTASATGEASWRQQAANRLCGAAALNNSEITTLYRESRLNEVMKWTPCVGPLEQ